MLVKKDINVGDSVVMPVHLHESIKSRQGVCVAVNKRFFIVEFTGIYKDDNGKQAKYRECYSLFGEEEKPNEVLSTYEIGIN